MFNYSNFWYYIDKVNNNDIFYENEFLTPVEKYNEYIMTGLRTIWGVNLERIKENFGEYFLKYFLNCSNKYIVTKHLKNENGIITLTDEGKLISDRIISDCFYLE